MESIFKQSDNQKLIDRINKLTNSSANQWGKMNVAQMLAHCQSPLNVAFGEHKIKRGLISILFGKMIKNKLMKDDKPFDRNLPTDKTFIVVDQREFDKEKNRLIELIKRFAEKGENGLTKDPHPFFGKLTGHEWDVLQWKHLDHHLRQFGV
ncbi:MAG: hypothetical protein K0Q95_917 [Bacteroidota bacterium]|jgi:hypothetical protein|nr:hypothetical protein [Bacteroidota bacterium]